jgi:hypothetical protein
MPEELAAWIYLGPAEGGLAAYLNANELNPPPRFDYAIYHGGSHYDYISPLMACWFCEEELANFEPNDRFISGKDLVRRWETVGGIQPDAFIRAKIAESRLLDMHPTFGCTQGSLPEDQGFPPLEVGLFSMTEVRQIEEEDSLGVEEDQAGIALPSATAKVERPVRMGGNFEFFREMENLRSDELKMTFVGDRQESGLTGNNMIEISARGTSRRVALGEFDLVDRRGGALNQQAAVLVGLAGGDTFFRSEEKNSAIIARLRKVIQKHLGVIGDPFFPYSKGGGWRPRFAIEDARGRSDDRAKMVAEQRMVSFDQLQDQGMQISDSGTDEENACVDDADRWLSEHDPHHSS